jgi:small-conductance mechanosensitive channel
MQAWVDDVPPGVWAALILAAAACCGLVIHRFGFAIGRRFARRVGGFAAEVIVRRAQRSARLIVPLILMLLAFPALPLGPAVAEPLRRVLLMVLVAAIGWLAIALAHAGRDIIVARYNIAVADNRAARQMVTRVHVFLRITVTILVAITVGIMVMQIPSARSIGVSLFASAGVAGIVIGFAARPLLSNLLAGLQIALTEPISLDDVVIIDGEWGRIEEITMTYVVVAIWDLRRMIVPLSYFIEKPFQNWTRTTANLLGSVYLYVDYSVPVDAVRAELKRVLDQSKLWDGKIWNLQVSDARERTVELRALMSAPDSGRAWDLRCEVREKLLAFLQAKYPQSLPRIRAEIAREDPASKPERVREAAR